MSKQIWTAESIFPGHPDKLADAVADAIVAEAGRREKRALVGVEVAVHRNNVFITGRVACTGAEDIDFNRLVRDVYASAGYNETWYPSADQVNVAHDLCLGPLIDGESDYRALSDDQSIVTGYAINSAATDFLPIEHYACRHLCRALEKLPVEHPELLLGPDGKVIIHLEETLDTARITSVSVSLQQQIEGNPIDLHRTIGETVEEYCVALASACPEFVFDAKPEIEVNGAGNFAVGGPEGDNGLSGKKLVVDAYGPRVPIGGGALSGKDFFKVDRAGAIAARRLAKAVVQSGQAEQCTVTLSFHPGADKPRIVSLKNERGELLSAGCWEQLFDFRLESIGEGYTGTADLIEVARHGHFTDPDLPWEQLSFDAVRRVG